MNLLKEKIEQWMWGDRITWSYRFTSSSSDVFMRFGEGTLTRTEAKYYLQPRSSRGVGTFGVEYEYTFMPIDLTKYPSPKEYEKWIVAQFYINNKWRIHKYCSGDYEAISYHSRDIPDGVLPYIPTTHECYLHTNGGGNWKAYSTRITYTSTPSQQRGQRVALPTYTIPIELRCRFCFIERIKNTTQEELLAKTTIPVELIQHILSFLFSPTPPS